MPSQVVNIVHTGLILLRMIAVISSSIATILSSLLPLFLFSSYSMGYLLFMLVFLSMAAVLVHGGLTHVFNDYADFISGTDAHSPALLSGGSRVIQKGLIRPYSLWKLGKWIANLLLITAVLMVVLGLYKLTILILVGVWAAYSYSLPPLQLSYRPFLGEWLSLFPSILFLGFAGPWIIFGSIPLWALQNAVINAFVCMAWVMVHHIPDIHADRMAVPIKRTSVVWVVDQFGLKWARFPAFLYFLLAGLCVFWLVPDRLLAALILGCIILYILFLVIKMDPNNLQQVTNHEKIFLLFAVMIAIVLGVL